MFVKHLSVVVMMLVVGAGCAAPADDESDAVEESATATGEGSQALRRGEDVPLNYVPVPNVGHVRDWKEWEPPQFGRELWVTRAIGCFVHDVKVYNPAREEYIQVPVTVCN